VPRPDLPQWPFWFYERLKKTSLIIALQISWLTSLSRTSLSRTNIPQIPNFPIQQPMNFTGLPNIPASSVIQPRVEDIIAPIRTGSTRRLPQPGLFNLR
jgi:hypothetical protein